MMSAGRAGTRLRELGVEPDNMGVARLGATTIRYRDGAERSVLEIITQATDRSSISDSLLPAAADWPQTYHLHPSRGNLVRALDVRPDMSVLEVGAGCGAITRTLGETGATVDALEPVLVRAQAASARTQDLPGVQVFQGLVEDVPEPADYDVVVVVGVLEYVASGATDRGTYLRWLSKISRVLKPGGALVLAIENKLGVKYLVGAPEDHSSRPFDSIEGYPWPAPARTFDRAELVRLLTDAGFSVTTGLGVFPDYKVPRLVYANGQSHGVQTDVLGRLPRFPSPDWSTPRPPLADEARLWRSLTGAGLADEFANSFMMIAHTPGTGRSQLWRDGVVAHYFADHTRRPRYGYTATVYQRADGLGVRREGWARDDRDAWLTHQPSDSIWIPGQDLADLGPTLPDEELGRLLRDWAQLLASTPTGNRGLEIDLVPHNLVVGGLDGDVHSVDAEWYSTRHSIDAVAARGLFFLADRFAESPEGATRWGGMTVMGLARNLASASGWDPGIMDRGPWISLEGEVQEMVYGGSRTSHSSLLVETASRKVDGVRRVLRAHRTGAIWEREERARGAAGVIDLMSRGRDHAARSLTDLLRG